MYDVALFKLFADKFGIYRILMLLDVCLHTRRLRRNRNKRHHSVSAVYIKQLCDRTELVCRVVLAAAVKIIAQAIMSVLLAVRHLFSEVVRIRACTVNDLTENALSRHRGCEKLELVVAAVFHKHKRNLCLFPCADELIAIVHQIRAADFEKDSLARLHCGDGYRNVIFP